MHSARTSQTVLDHYPYLEYFEFGTSQSLTIGLEQVMTTDEELANRQRGNFPHSEPEILPFTTVPQKYSFKVMGVA